MQQLEIVNNANEDGNITGGHVRGIGIDIQWQDGVIVNGQRNGALVEEVLGGVVARLQAYQQGPLSTRHNSLAITKLEEALHWLEARRRDREARGVADTYQP